MTDGKPASQQPTSAVSGVPEAGLRALIAGVLVGQLLACLAVSAVWDAFGWRAGLTVMVGIAGGQLWAVNLRIMRERRSR